MDLAVLFSNLVGLFLLIGVGFFVVRSGLLPAEASKPMSTLLMKVTVPATIIHSMLRPFDPGFLRLGISIFLVYLPNRRGDLPPVRRAVSGAGPAVPGAGGAAGDVVLLHHLLQQWLYGLSGGAGPLR